MLDSLRPLDLLVILKIVALGRPDASVRDLADDLGVPKSTVALSLRRLEALGLLKGEGQSRRIDRLVLRDCLEHGARWVAPASIGGWVHGLPTAHTANPLRSKLRGDDDPVVMPLMRGPARGRGVSPLHPKAPRAAAKDPKLHELLCLVDALRIGRARDRELAARELARACKG